MMAAIIFGVVPAIRAARSLPANELKAGGRTVSGGRGWETAKMLVAAQVALSLLLLVCAGLLIRTVRNLQLFDPGFDREQLYLISTNFLGYKGPQTARLIKEMRDRTASLPGARAVGIAQDIPPADRRLNVTVDGAPSLPNEKMYVDRLLVGPGFFDVMGIPLTAGRAITERDDERAPNVCVVSAAMARTFFPDRSPLGRHFTFKRTGAEYEVEIVGVAKDLKKADPNGEWRPVYCPMLQDLPSGGATVLVRTGRDAAPVIAEARRRLHAIDSNLFIDVRTMDRRMEDTVFLQRMMAMLSGVFGSLALVLASIGLYGVMAYSVARRTNEVGIRMALGADRSRVIATVVSETMTLVAAGVLLGMGAAWVATRLLSSTLFGLTATDPATLTVAIGVMLTVALLAGYMPARRAAAVNPVIALRQE
jgi:predicted permease